MITILAFLASMILLIAGPIAHGYVLTVLWGWFVVPTFGLPPLGLAAAIGLGLIVSLSRSKWRTKDEDLDWADTIARGAGYAILLPALFLFAGWIVQHWM